MIDEKAANLGIDNLEHGFFAATDFVKEKVVDKYPKRDALSVLIPQVRNQYEANCQAIANKKAMLLEKPCCWKSHVVGKTICPDDSHLLLLNKILCKYIPVAFEM